MKRNLINPFDIINNIDNNNNRLIYFKEILEQIYSSLNVIKNCNKEEAKSYIQKLLFSDTEYKGRYIKYPILCSFYASLNVDKISDIIIKNIKVSTNVWDNVIIELFIYDRFNNINGKVVYEYRVSDSYAILFEITGIKNIYTLKELFENVMNLLLIVFKDRWNSLYSSE